MFTGYVRSAPIFVESKVSAPRKTGYIRNPFINYFTNGFLQDFVAVFVSNPKQWRSEMKPTTMPKHFVSKVLIIADAVVDIHSQPSKHDTDQPNTGLADVHVNKHTNLSPSGTCTGHVIKVMARKPWRRVRCRCLSGIFAFS